MSTHDNGGPAFPKQAYVTPNGFFVRSNDGMTLRDWFAGQVLAGLLSRPNYVFDARDRRLIAADTYAMAGAMLAARKEGK